MGQETLNLAESQVPEGRPDARPPDPPGTRTGEHNFAITLMQHLVVPTFVIDADCRVMIWNAACETLTGLAANQVIGTREHWRGFYKEPRPCLADLLAQGRLAEAKTMYATHEPLADSSFGVHAENWCVMPQLGTELYLAIDAGPIYHEDGRLLAVIETLRDISTHKRAHTALKQLAVGTDPGGQGENISSFRARNHHAIAMLLDRVSQVCRKNPSGDRLRCDACPTSDEQQACRNLISELASGLMTALLDHVNHEDGLMSVLPAAQAAKEHCREHRTRHAESTTRINRILSETRLQDPFRNAGKLEEFMIDWIRTHALEYDAALDKLAFDSARVPPHN